MAHVIETTAPSHSSKRDLAMVRPEIGRVRVDDFTCQKKAKQRTRRKNKPIWEKWDKVRWGQNWHNVTGRKDLK